MKIEMKYDGKNRLINKIYKDEQTNHRSIEFSYHEDSGVIKEMKTSIIPGAESGKIVKPTPVETKRYDKNGQLVNVKLYTAGELTVEYIYTPEEYDSQRYYDDFVENEDDTVNTTSYIIGKGLYKVIKDNRDGKKNATVDIKRIIGKGIDIPYETIKITSQFKDENDRYIRQISEYYIEAENNKAIPLYFADHINRDGFSYLNLSTYEEAGIDARLIKNTTEISLEENFESIQSEQGSETFYDADTRKPTTTIMTRRRYSEPVEFSKKEILHKYEERDEDGRHIEEFITWAEGDSVKSIVHKEFSSDSERKLLYYSSSLSNEHVPQMQYLYEYDDKGRESFYFAADNSNTNIIGTITTYKEDSDNIDLSIGLYNYITHEYDSNNNLVGIETHIYDDKSSEKYLLPLLVKLATLDKIGTKEIFQLVVDLKQRYFKNRKMAELLRDIKLDTIQVVESTEDGDA